MATVAFLGFGELGAALARRLEARGGHELRAWMRPRKRGDAGEAVLEERLRSAGVVSTGSLAEAVRGAETVLAVVPGSSSLELAEQSAGLLDSGALYVDLTAAPVAAKQAGAKAVEDAGSRYVDAAVLGTAAVPDATIPIVASGDGAEDWRRLGGPCEGFSVEVLDGPAGQATQLKLLRSVYMKGRDALVVETLLAARRSGLEERLLTSIGGPGERVSFPELVDRVLRSLAVHAGRRAAELDSSAEAVREAGVEPVLTSAAATVLRRVAVADLREAFGGERPESGAEVLALLDARL
jgi:3-hydroxyisobutyrate dehydrogenase-like beta-hydroxyacid dehydrogenase